MAQPGARGDLAGIDLGAHARRAIARRRPPPAIASISGRDFRDGLKELRIGIKMRRGSVEPIDIGEEHQQIGAGHGGDAGGQAIIIGRSGFRSWATVSFSLMIGTGHASSGAG